MDLAGQAIAQARDPRPPLWDPRLLWLALALIAILLIGALIIAWVDRWRKRTDSERLTANEQLANFRRLYEEGQLSQEEFERVRLLLSEQLRRELAVPAAPPRTAEEPTPEAQKPTEPGSPPG